MKVLEISTSSAAGYAGALLAELGFEVDRIAVKSRVTSRSQSEETAREVFLHHAKKSLDDQEIDLTPYDAVIEDVGSRKLRQLGLSRRKIRQISADMVLVSLSPFGLTGPYAHWRGTELNVQAVGGVMHMCGYDGEAPRKLPGDTAACIAGLHAATAVAAAVQGVAVGKEVGVHIDISAQDTFLQHWIRHVGNYVYSGTYLKRSTRNPSGIHGRQTARAKDGWLYLLALRIPWQDVARFLGLGRFVTEEYEKADLNTQPLWSEMEPEFEASILAKDRYEWFSDAAKQGWTFAPIEDPLHIVDGPQNRARGFFKSVDVDGKEVKVPGLPYRITNDIT